MIKVKQEFNHSTGEYFLSTNVICRTNKTNKWYSISDYSFFRMYWNNPSDPILGPTCLSAWSK